MSELKKMPLSESLPAAHATAIDKLIPFLAGAVVLEYLWLASAKAIVKFLWLDEIMGVLIAKLPTIQQIWEICRSGADNQPVFYHLLVRASIGLFGTDALGARAPSIAGYGLFCLCLYLFVSRRTSGSCGLVALLLPPFMHSWYYVTEARPYSLLLGLAASAAVCWQSAADRESRRALPLLGLAASIALAVNVHYYSVVLLAPFALAELVRFVDRRRIDLPLWLALTLPYLLFFVYLPTIRASRSASGVPYAYYAKPELSVSPWNFAGEFLSPIVPAAIVISVLYLYFVSSARFVPTRLVPNDQTRDVAAVDPLSRTDQTPAHMRRDLALAVGFVLLPLAAVVLSRFGSHIFFSRYANSSVFGFAAVPAFALHFAFRERKKALLWTIAALSLLVYHDQKPEIAWVRTDTGSETGGRILKRIPDFALHSDLVIVPTNLDDFMQFFYYGDAALKKRLVYVSSEQLAVHYLGFSFHERMMRGAAPFFETQVIDYHQFRQTYSDYFVFGSLQFSEWFIPKLLDDKVQLTLVQGGPTDIFGGFADPCFLAHSQASLAHSHP